MMLQIYLKEYTDLVFRINKYFIREYQIADVLKGVRDGIVPKQGVIFLPQKGEYFFHGIGCRVFFSDCTINFDYSPKGVCGGFTVFDIVGFLNSRGVVIPESRVSELLENYLGEGVLVFPKFKPNSALYYFKEDINLKNC